MEGYRDKYLQLDQLVKQLYMDACDSTGLVNTKGAKNGAKNGGLTGRRRERQIKKD